MRRIGTIWAVILAMLVAIPATAQVQNRVDAKRDWAIFEAGEGQSKVCWIVTQPTKSVALRGGTQVQVRRGDIYLMVAVRPGQGVRNEVSFISGYPFRQGSTVTAKVGSSSYTLFTDGENAWLEGPAQDAEAVSAFRKGVNTIVEGTSSRGTTTVDTFSLLGFTAALDSAQSRCGVSS